MAYGQESRPAGVAVYCASSIGKKAVYEKVAISLGAALARSGRHLVYGGGGRGLMGVVSQAALRSGGNATGIIPYALAKSGGEKSAGGIQTNGRRNSVAELRGVKNYHDDLPDEAKARLESVIVQSMHERKVEMAERVGAFIGLPGGFGTFEEVFEVTTWTQLGIHAKPVVLLNVNSYYDPLRQLVQNGVREGFIHPQNGKLIIFVDGPEDHAEHETFDWGAAALEALDGWVNSSATEVQYDWSTKLNGVDTYNST